MSQDDTLFKDSGPPFPGSAIPTVRLTLTLTLTPMPDRGNGGPREWRTREWGAGTLFKSASAVATAAKFSLLVDSVGNLLCPSACLSATWRFQELAVAAFWRLLCSSQQYTVPRHRRRIQQALLWVHSTTHKQPPELSVLSQVDCFSMINRMWACQPVKQHRLSMQTTMSSMSIKITNHLHGGQSNSQSALFSADCYSLKRIRVNCLCQPRKFNRITYLLQTDYQTGIWILVLLLSKQIP